jgi:sn-glycerol 3-phosphate transport system substrate-binding protein
VTARTTLAAVVTLASAVACSSSDEAFTPASETVAPTLSAPSTADVPATEPPPSDSTAESTLPDDPSGRVRCDTSSGTEGVDTLRVWHAMGGDVENLLTLFAVRFQGEHPGTNVELTRIDGYETVITLLADTPQSDWPDVVMGSNLTVRLQADSDRFIAPSECTDGQIPAHLANLYAPIRRTYTVDGTLWAAPFNVSVPVMMFDQKRWVRAGLDPADPPTDVAELERVIRHLKDSGEATTGAVLYDLSARWFIDQTAARSKQLLIEPANGHQGLDTDRVVLTSGEHVAVLTTLQELRQDGYLHWAGENPAGTVDLEQLVRATDPSGLTFNTSAVLGDIIRLLQSGLLPEVEIGVAPFPGPGTGSTVGGGAWWLLDHDDPQRAGAAWVLIDWLAAPERVAELAAYTGYVPTTPQAAAQDLLQDWWAEWPVLRVAHDQLLATPDSDAGAGLQVGPLPDALDAIEAAAVDIIDGGAEPVERLAAAEREVTSLLAFYAARSG